MDVKSIPKLTMLMFPAWEKAVTIALIAEGTWEIVEGRETQPVATTPLSGTINGAMRKQREKEDDEFVIKLHSFTTRSGKAIWMISQMLEEEIDQHIRDTNSPFNMWKLLRDTMDTRKNPVHQWVIRKQYSDIIHDGKGTIDEYINKLKEFQRALNGTMNPIWDDAQVNKIITMLLAEWDLKLRIIEDDPDLTLVKLEKVLRSYQITLNTRKV